MKFEELNNQLNMELETLRQKLEEVSSNWLPVLVVAYYRHC